MIKTALNRNELLIMLSSLKFCAKIIAFIAVILAFYFGFGMSFSLFDIQKMKFFITTALLVLTAINVFFVICLINADINFTDDNAGKVFRYLIIIFWLTAAVFWFALYKLGIKSGTGADYIITVTAIILGMQFIFALMAGLIRCKN